jgi:hypothetical protein
MRARPFVAQAQALLAKTRIAADPRAREDAQVTSLLEEAAATAGELGLVQVTALVDGLRRPVVPRRDTGACTFRCDGEVWTVRFGGREVRLRHGKGPSYLATLLAVPNREVHVLELCGSSPGEGAVAAAAEGLTIGGPGGTLEDAPDVRAMREYRVRLDDLRSELEEAEQSCDRGRAERLHAEIDFLVSQLAQRFGSRARTRGPAETARKAVTKVLRTQIAKILEIHPPLGEHLRDFVRMGTFCVYAPSTPTSWDVATATASRVRPGGASRAPHLPVRRGSRRGERGAA